MTLINTQSYFSGSKMEGHEAILIWAPHQELTDAKSTVNMSTSEFLVVLLSFLHIQFWLACSNYYMLEQDTNFLHKYKNEYRQPGLFPE